MLVVVSGSDGGGFFIGCIIAVGVVWGAIYVIMGGSIVEAIAFTASTTYGFFSYLGDHVESLAPTSTALYFIGEIIKYAGGGFSALCVGFGAFWGALIIWVPKDIIGGLLHSAVHAHP